MQEAIECRIASEILAFVPFCLIKVPEYLERDTSPRGGRGIQGSDSKRSYLKKGNAFFKSGDTVPFCVMEEKLMKVVAVKK